jgi:hypothetical protein
MKISTTKVYEINGNLVVADNVENAIKIFREKFPFPNDVVTINLVQSKEGCLALIDIP